jgi:hypothetical protein
MNQLNDRADFAGLLGKPVDFLGGIGRVFRQAMQVLGNFRGRLPTLERNRRRFQGAIFFLLEQIGHLAQAALRTGQRIAEQRQIAQYRFQRFTLPLLVGGRLLLREQRIFQRCDLGHKRLVFGFRCGQLIFQRHNLIAFSPEHPRTPDLIIFHMTENIYIPID